MGTVTTISIGTSTYSVYSVSGNPTTEAASYLNGLLGTGSTAWSEATADNRKRALITAADWMDRATRDILSGTKTSSVQAREWPRTGATCNGTAVTDNTTPDQIAYAQFWLAGVVLSDSTLAAGTGTGSNVKEAKAGSASVTFFSATSGTASDTRLPITAMDLLKCYFSGAGISTAAGVAYGVSSSSAFCSSDFKLSEGLS
jgi:hypothetical protein